MWPPGVNAIYCFWIHQHQHDFFAWCVSFAGVRSFSVSIDFDWLIFFVFFVVVCVRRPWSVKQQQEPGDFDGFLFLFLSFFCSLRLFVQNNQWQHLATRILNHSSSSFVFLLVFRGSSSFSISIWVDCEFFGETKFYLSNFCFEQSLKVSSANFINFVFRYFWTFYWMSSFIFILKILKSPYLSPT